MASAQHVEDPKKSVSVEYVPEKMSAVAASDPTFAEFAAIFDKFKAEEPEPEPEPEKKVKKEDKKVRLRRHRSRRCLTMLCSHRLDHHPPSVPRRPAAVASAPRALSLNELEPRSNR